MSKRYAYRKEIAAEEVRRLLDYDPETGVFRWKVRTSSRAAAGDVAGCVRPDRYVVIGIKGVMYLAHRLAWLYVTGEWPALDIDHRDLDPGNNRFDNFRQVTHSQNHCNIRKPRTNTSGYKGVVWCKKDRAYSARIKLRGRNHYLGNFDDPAVAHAAYVRASERLHGEFGRPD